MAANVVNYCVCEIKGGTDETILHCWYARREETHRREPDTRDPHSRDTLVLSVSNYKSEDFAAL